MSIDIKFDLMGNPEPPSIVLANRNGNRLGQLKVNVDSIDVKDKFGDIDEFSFTLNKYIDGEPTPLWDKVVDFKLVNCPEWDLWFEITVELDEATETVKTVYCTQLGQSELSQIMIYNTEINTEADIGREDYKTSILYDEKNPESSILHRLLEKAPHYSIAYVDESIQRIQRQFSFDGVSICEAFNEIAEEIGCLFVYNSNSQAGGKPNRTISVYDLQQNCNNKDCKYRGEFTDKCPKCGSTDITYGYGEDTTIFVTADELATEGIQLVTDTDSVKNCFKLEAGDDLMTATIRNCNPNGSDYIWYFSDSMKEDMSKELVDRIEGYDELYKEHYNSHISQLNGTLVNQYNNLVAKYDDYYNTKSTCLDCKNEGDFEEQCPKCNSKNILTGQKLQTIPTTITGYPALMTAYYNTIDLLLYLESGLMPNVKMSDTTAEAQVGLLTTPSLSPVAVNVKDIKNASEATANSAVLSMAKVLIRPTYKVDIVDGSSSLSKVDANGEYKTWTGKFVVTNYSDDKDTATSGIISVRINNATETFIEQKIDKALNKENTDDYSIAGLFAKDYADFCNELKKYALNPLDNFSKACDTCISILTEQGAGDEDGKPDLYAKLYKPYFDKQRAINDEIKVRESEIAIIEGVWDKSEENNQKCIIKGLQQYIEDCQKEIQDALNFEGYLGEDLWLEFCSYRREDKYSNSNYISDGLDNAELFKKANEFIEVAQEEIFKSAELQHSISANLNNLLALPKFKPLLKSFKTGNWIRVRIDDKVYKLRLLEYNFGYGDSKNISVEFSDVTKIKNGITDVQDVFEQASSMASSYDSVQRQAEKGNVARSTIDQWIVDGLNSANVQIRNNDSEEVILTQTGLLARSYDDITGTYSPEQFKLTHNIMAYTDDNWETVSSALGKHNYKYWKDNNFVDAEGYGLTSKFVSAGYITGSQIISGEIVSSNYKPKELGTYFNLNNGDFEIAGGKITYDASGNAVTLKGVTIQWDSLTEKPTVNDISDLGGYLDQLEDLEDQLDGRIQTYSQSDDPSISWTDEEKANHIGDLWLNPNTGLTKRWSGNGWLIVTDSDLKELAQSKAQIFTSTPTPPYYVGDLWVQGATGDIMHCINKRESGTYAADDWSKSSKYTNDDALNSFIEGDYQQTIDNLQNSIDNKTDAYYQATKPHEEYNNVDDTDNYNLWVGDLWYDTTLGKTYIYQKKASTSGKYIYQWEFMNVPNEVFDTIDGIASIYITEPENAVIGDLLIPVADIKDGDTIKYEAGKVYRYNGSTWNEINYTDDSALHTFIEGDYADDLDDIKTQIDGRAQTWYQSTDPSLSWTNDEKSVHVGDLWYDADDNGRTYVYNSSYKWEEMNGVPKGVFDMADGSCSLYVSKPSNYRKNDIWILDVENANGNDTTYPKYEKGTFLVSSSDNSGYSVNDWSEQVKYSNKLNNFIENDYKNTLESLHNSIDGKADTYYQEIKPHEEYSNIDDTNTYNLWVGDLWYDTTSGKTYIYQKTAIDNNKYKYEWKFMDVPDSVFDAIDSVASIYTIIPKNPIVGDLLIPTSDLSGGYKAGKVYRYDGSAWNEVSYTDDSAFNTFVNGTYATTISNINTQLDKKAETWYQSTDPSTAWTNDEAKENHLGDLWHYTGETTQTRGKNTEWIWQKVSGSYQWAAMDVPDSVFDAIDGKAQIFVSTPTPPYYVGDLWVQGSSGEIMRCVTERTTGNYATSDWEKASKYTDDSSFNNWVGKDFVETIQGLQEQIDGKTDTYYQDTMPKWDNDDSEHIGDMWYCTKDYTLDNITYSTGKTYMFDGEDWIEVEGKIPEEVYDLIDGKASIYIIFPTDTSILNKGDLLILAEDCEPYKANKVYKWTGEEWDEIKYTDDTLAQQALEEARQGIKDAGEAFSLAETAKKRAEDAETNSKSYTDDKATELKTAYESYTNSEVGKLDEKVSDYLGWDGTTIINDKYVISPYLGGGYLNITGINVYKDNRVIIDPSYLSNTDYIFQVQNANGIAVGIKDTGDAVFRGNITATSLTLDGASIPYEKIDNKPTKLSEFENDLDVATTDYVKVESTTDETTGITTTITTVGDKSYTTYTSEGADYLLTNIGMGSATPLEDDISDAGYTNGYFKVSKEGLLIANNAIIWGTIYATDGKFTGDIVANSLTLGDGVKISTKDIDGIDEYAKIDEIEGVPDNVLTTDDVVISESKTENGVTTQKITVGDNEYTSIISGDFVFTDIGLGTDTTDGSKRYTCISKDGLLTAKNAIIYGTIYATDGKFSGDIVANSLTLNNDMKIGDEENGYHTWISTDGILNANGANITGVINATDGGTIAGWSIGSDALYYNDTDSGVEVGLSAGSGGTYTTDDTEKNLGLVLYAGKKVTDTVGAIAGTWRFKDSIFTYMFTTYLDNSEKPLEFSFCGWFNHVTKGWTKYEKASAKLTFVHVSDTEKQIKLVVDGNERTLWSCDTGSDGKFDIYDNIGKFLLNREIGFGAEGIDDVWVGDYSFGKEILPNISTFIRGSIGLYPAMLDKDGKLYAQEIRLGGADNSMIEVDRCTVGNLVINDDAIVYKNGRDSDSVYEGLYVGKDGIYYGDSLRAHSSGISTSSVVVGGAVSTWTDGTVACKILRATEEIIGTVNTSSDRNKKNSIENLDERYDGFFDALEPQRFKYNNGTSDRYHLGYITQDVQEGLSQAGLTEQEFAGVITRDAGTDAEESYLRYNEFVALNTLQIQKLKKRVTELENKLKSSE